MRKLPRHCPACNTSLMVTRLTCPNCGTEVTGSFPPDLFSRLAPNDFDFLVLFVKSRGNVKEMERELGISYWTIRSRLNEIVVQLGIEPPAASSGVETRLAASAASSGVKAQLAVPAASSGVKAQLAVPAPPAAANTAARRQQILEQLNAGQLTVSEAAARLEELKNQP